MSGVAGGVAAGERLAWAIFVATAAHALLFLGLGFGPPQSAGPADVPTLEVTLLDAPVPDQPAPADAQYLAQASQEGVGNVAEQVRPEFFDTPPAPVPEQRTAMERGLEVEFVAMRDAALRADIAPLPEDADAQPAEVLPEGGVTRVTASGEREHFVSVNARESVFAEYLAGWKARMERLGTLNYPTSAGQRAGNPVLEVAVGADGKLREVRVTRGSGNAALDRAAMDLVRLASPYDPFPATLRAQFDVLRFAYEWRFIEGRASSRLSAPEH
ncbi:MAG: energy transducer TonB family protein [Gammaproteobacteria bacterium]